MKSLGFFNRIKKNPQVSFYIITLCVIVFLTVTKLVQDGMFMDGMLYTSVSHNMSQGIGTFWFPVFSPSYFNSGSPYFMEHPPLVFGIQSIFFRILGEGMYVEKIYIFLMLSLTALAIHFFWRYIYKNDPASSSIGWLPILIWITIPTSSWGYSNNMQENSMGLFSLMAVYFSFVTMESDRKRPFLVILSGIFVFFASFSKGVPGLFPAAIPVLHWLILRKKGILESIVITVIIVAIPALIYFILMQFPQSRESLSFYVTERLLGRVNNDPTVGSRFYIVKRLFSELAPVLLLTIGLYIFQRIRKTFTIISSTSRYAIFLLSVGLSASLPLMLTKVQRGFYLIPSFPYFAIGFGIILAPAFVLLTKRISEEPVWSRYLLRFSMVLIISGLLTSVILSGKSSRDVEMLHDVHLIGKNIDKGASMTVSADLYQDFSLECYFMRYFNISLYKDESQREYFLCRKNSNLTNPLYELVQLNTLSYNLYRRK